VKISISSISLLLLYRRCVELLFDDFPTLLKCCEVIEQKLGPRLARSASIICQRCKYAQHAFIDRPDPFDTAVAGDSASSHDLGKFPPSEVCSHTPLEVVARAQEIKCYLIRGFATVTRTALVNRRSVPLEAHASHAVGTMWM